MCSEPVMRAPFSGFDAPIFLAQRHQARHLGLGDLDFLAAEIGEADVLDDIVGETGFSLGRHVENLRFNVIVRACAVAAAPSRASRQSKYKEFFICRLRD